MRTAPHGRCKKRPVPGEEPSKGHRFAMPLLFLPPPPATTTNSPSGHTAQYRGAPYFWACFFLPMARVMDDDQDLHLSIKQLLSNADVQSHVCHRCCNTCSCRCSTPRSAALHLIFLQVEKPEQETDPRPILPHVPDDFKSLEEQTLSDPHTKATVPLLETAKAMHRSRSDVLQHCGAFLSRKPAPA